MSSLAFTAENSMSRHNVISVIHRRQFHVKTQCHLWHSPQKIPCQDTMSSLSFTAENSMSGHNVISVIHRRKFHVKTQCHLCQSPWWLVAVHSLNFHSCRHMGQGWWTCWELSHLTMQWMWKQWEHCPHTETHRIKHKISKWPCTVVHRVTQWHTHTHSHTHTHIHTEAITGKSSVFISSNSPCYALCGWLGVKTTIIYLSIQFIIHRPLVLGLGWPNSKEGGPIHLL